MGGGHRARPLVMVAPLIALATLILAACGHGTETARSTTSTTTPSKAFAAPPTTVQKTVPNVVGLNYQVAQVDMATIGSLGLPVDYRLVHDSTIASGLVVAETPVAGTEVNDSMNVTLTVSIGPAAVPGASSCQAADLHVSLGPPVSEATGQDTVDVAFTNMAQSTCVVDGYPTVSLVDATGKRLGFIYSRSGDQMTTDAAPGPVYLLPGSAAWLRVNRYRCDIAIQDESSTMLLSPPGAVGTLSVPASFSYCDEAASLIVTISPFEPIELLLSRNVPDLTLG